MYLLTEVDMHVVGGVVVVDTPRYGLDRPHVGKMCAEAWYL